MATILGLVTVAESKPSAKEVKISLIVFTDEGLIYIGDTQHLGKQASLINPVGLGLAFISSTTNTEMLRESLNAIKGLKIDPSSIAKKVKEAYVLPYDKIKSITVKKPFFFRGSRLKLRIKVKDGTTYEYVIWPHQYLKALGEGDPYRGLINLIGQVPQLRPLVGAK